jgi:hypothetical protein
MPTTMPIDLMTGSRHELAVRYWKQSKAVVVRTELMSASAKVAETGRDPSAVTSVIRHTVRAGSESGWGQTRSLGDVGSMSGLPESGHG